MGSLQEGDKQEKHTKAHNDTTRSEERFSRNAETDLVCRLLLEKKKKGSTVAAASSLEKDMRSKTGANVDAAKAVGKLVAQRALEKGVKSVVFDRGGYLYHGRIKALADAAREGGLQF